MKKLLIITIALTAIGVAVKAMYRRKSNLKLKEAKTIANNASNAIQIAIDSTTF